MGIIIIKKCFAITPHLYNRIIILKKREKFLSEIVLNNMVEILKAYKLFF